MPMQVTREIDNNLTFEEEEEEEENDTQKYNVRVKFTWILQQCPTIYIVGASAMEPFSFSC